MPGLHRVIQLRVSDADYITFKNARLHISHICRMALRTAVLAQSKGKLVPSNENSVYSRKDAVKAWNRINLSIIPLISQCELNEIYHSTYPIREFYTKISSKVSGKMLHDCMTFINGDEISEEILMIAFKDIMEDQKFQQKDLRGVEKCA